MLRRIARRRDSGGGAAAGLERVSEGARIQRHHGTPLANNLEWHGQRVPSSSESLVGRR